MRKTPIKLGSLDVSSEPLNIAVKTSKPLSQTHIEGSTLFAAPPYDAKMYRLLLDYCMRIMGRKSYSVRELTNKMKQKVKRIEKYGASGFLKRGDVSSVTLDASAEIAAVLEKLQGWGYLSDKKIIDSVIDATLSHKPQGPNAFLASMMKKGISKDEAKTAWAEKNIDERALAVEVAKKYAQKYRKLEPQAKKRRLAGVLARKGFRGDTIWSVIAEQNLL